MVKTVALQQKGALESLYVEFACSPSSGVGADVEKQIILPNNMMQTKWEGPDC